MSSMQKRNSFQKFSKRIEKNPSDLKDKEIRSRIRNAYKSLPNYDLRRTRIQNEQAALLPFVKQEEELSKRLKDLERNPSHKLLGISLAPMKPSATRELKMLSQQLADLRKRYAVRDGKNFSSVIHRYRYLDCMIKRIDKDEVTTESRLRNLTIELSKRARALEAEKFKYEGVTALAAAHIDKTRELADKKKSSSKERKNVLIAAKPSMKTHM